MAGAVVIGGDYQGLGIVRSLGRRGVEVLVRRRRAFDQPPLAVRHRRRARPRPARRSTPPSRRCWSSASATASTAGCCSRPARRPSRRCRATASCSLARFRVPTPAVGGRQVGVGQAQHLRAGGRARDPDAAHLDAARRAGSRRARRRRRPVRGQAGDQGALPVRHRQEGVAGRHPRAAARARARGLAAARRRGGDRAGADPGVRRDAARLLRLLPRRRPAASMIVRRLRQHPPLFGRASTFVETIEQPELEELSERFLRHIGYYGLVELEYKHDPRDGLTKLLDVNARTWGYHSLGQRAGVDFPHLLFADQSLPQAGSRPRRPALPAPASAGSGSPPTCPRRSWASPAGRSGWRSYLRSLRAADVESVFTPRRPASRAGGARPAPLPGRQAGLLLSVAPSRPLSAIPNSATPSSARATRQGTSGSRVDELAEARRCARCRRRAAAPRASAPRRCSSSKRTLRVVWLLSWTNRSICSQLGQQRRQASAAGAVPGTSTRRAALRDRGADLGVQGGVERGQVDAVERARAVALERLEDHPRGDAPRHPGLQHRGGRAGAGTGTTRPARGPRRRRPSRRRPRGRSPGPARAGLGRRCDHRLSNSRVPRARPGRPEALVQLLLPVRDRAS